MKGAIIPSCNSLGQKLCQYSRATRDWNFQDLPAQPRLCPPQPTRWNDWAALARIAREHDCAAGGTQWLLPLARSGLYSWHLIRGAGHLASSSGVGGARTSKAAAAGREGPSSTSAYDHPTYTCMHTSHGKACRNSMAMASRMDGGSWVTRSAASSRRRT